MQLQDRMTAENQYRKGCHFMKSLSEQMCGTYHRKTITLFRIPKEYCMLVCEKLLIFGNLRLPDIIHIFA